MLRQEGVYHCGDAITTGLSLTNAEAAALRSDPRGARIHPRTFLLEPRRRVAVVLDWHLPHAECPFYESHRCTVYEKRPLPCRAFPVMLASPLQLAPECPKVPVPRAALRLELRARDAIERAHASLDETAMRLLARGAFARGLTSAEARARLRRYRVATPEEMLAWPERATS
jgi:Fe-S-cluster containining protein